VVVRGVPGAQLRFNGMVFPEPGENNRAFTVRNLSPAATQIELEGVARFTFPLEYRDIRFEKPGTVESRDLGDTTVKLTRGGSTEIWMLSFHKNPSATTPSWSRMISQRFDPDSFVVVDVEGNEFTGTMRAPNVRGRQFDALGGRRLVPGGNPAQLEQRDQGSALPLRRSDAGEVPALQVQRVAAALGACPSNQKHPQLVGRGCGKQMCRINRYPMISISRTRS
jgi:hypothetical protein